MMKRSASYAGGALRWVKALALHAIYRRLNNRVALTNLTECSYNK